MNKKMLMLALTAISAALFALPAVASAGAPEVDLSKGGHFTVAGGHSELKTVGNKVTTCTSTTGTGEWLNKTTGSLQLTFHGCKELTLGTTCKTTSGDTITADNLTFHTIYTTDNKTSPGILITPPNGAPFATFTCAGGLIHIVVTGNGIIGSITQPPCGGTSNTATLNFSQTNGVQQHRQITGTGGLFTLSSDLNGGAAEHAGMNAEATMTLTEGAGTLTCV